MNFSEFTLKTSETPRQAQGKQKPRRQRVSASGGDPAEAESGKIIPDIEQDPLGYTRPKINKVEGSLSLPKLINPSIKLRVNQNVFQN